MWWTYITFGSNTAPSTQHSIDSGGGTMSFEHPPHNCSCLTHKNSLKFNKLSFWQNLCKYINNLIIFSKINKWDNILMYQLSQIMNMKFNMIHLSMGNKIINNFNNNLIITVNNNGVLNRKTKLIKKLMNPKCICTYIGNSMILNFYSWKKCYLLFLTQPNQGSKT